MPTSSCLSYSSSHANAEFAGDSYLLNFMSEPCTDTTWHSKTPIVWTHVQHNEYRSFFRQDCHYATKFEKLDMALLGHIDLEFLFWILKSDEIPGKLFIELYAFTYRQCFNRPMCHKKTSLGKGRDTHRSRAAYPVLASVLWACGDTGLEVVAYSFQSEGR